MQNLFFLKIPLKGYYGITAMNTHITSIYLLNTQKY